MTGKTLFGTDGVRGLANGTLTAELALELSVAAAHVLADLGEFEGHRPLAVVGRDTRISGQFLEAAVAGSCDYLVSGDRTVTIPPSGKAEFKVTFKPTGSGPRRRSYSRGL